MVSFIKYFLSLILVSSFSFAFDVSLVRVVSNIGIPWGMAFLDNNTMLINTKDGKVILYEIEKNKLITLKNPPNIYQKGQGGLLDIQLSPNFKKDGWIYFTYSKEIHSKGVTVLARAKLQGYALHSWQELLLTNSMTNTGVHFGSRITFDDKGYLYFGVGDRGHRPNGQDINTHAGTIMRLHLDGTIPHDNPFVETDGLDEIYSYGHRNPQGLFYDKTRDILFECEHGPRGGDEINIIQKGKNYGWARVSHGKEYWNFSDVGEAKSLEGMIDPLKVYIPSIAPSSLIVYSGKIFKQWKGDLFLGALALKHLNHIVLDDNLEVKSQNRLFEELDKRIRNVVESPDGYIYFSTDSGEIYKIIPKKS